MTGGLLIVNADDWGLDPRTTDAIARCFTLGAVSSASGMVFMSDSHRAAEKARESRWPIGLHLNFVEAYDDPRTPRAVSARQARLVDYFSGSSHRRWIPSPARFEDIHLCIQDQWCEFIRIYGQIPSHVDGHQHVHQALPVVLSRALPRGSRMRPSFTFRRGDKSFVNRVARGVLNTLIRTRFKTPRYLFSIRTVHPSLGGAGLDSVLHLSSSQSVELMTHPAWSDEAAILDSPAWLSAIEGFRLGSYADLG
jgi:predicted glycoside hydrolase/deacetylase ChbG (UPF0249 family)